MLKKATANFSKNFYYLALFLVCGALLMCWLNYLSVRQNFKDNLTKRTESDSLKIANQLDNFLIYAENLTKLLANNVATQDTQDPQKIAKILENIKPQIDYEKYNIFTLSLFNFVSPEGKLIATSSNGVIQEGIKIAAEKRPWLISARVEPRKFHITNSDTGIISGEEIIPIGFGVTNDYGKFLGFISIGINAQKICRALETSISNRTTSFVILNNDNSPIIASGNFQKSLLKNLQFQIGFEQEAGKDHGIINIKGHNYFYSRITHYRNLAILVGVDRTAAHSEFLASITPIFLNYFYFTAFFLILLYFFKIKLLNPVTILSAAANKISHGNTSIYIPQSKIAEIKSLSHSLELVRELVKKQQEEKLLAETENQNKSEFLASTAHEFKNIITSIVGTAEVIKSNFVAKKESKNHYFTSEEIQENQEFLEDIIKLSDEISSFIYDVIDVNQAASGNFKIEEAEYVDLKEIAQKSVKMLQVRAIKNKKHIVTHFSKGHDVNFNVAMLDPRRVKQIFVNILSNAIKYGAVDSKIELKMEALDKDVSELLRDSIINNVKQNPEISKKRKTLLLDVIQKARPKVIITVKDHGIGMTKEEIEVALEKYSRIENQHQHFDSTGLGLPIVKYLVEMQGGMLTINSQKNVGTEVKIIF